MRAEPDARVKVPKWSRVGSSRNRKRCWFIETAGQWTWKSLSAKKCVTTYLPNGLALKMDGAEADRPKLGWGCNYVFLMYDAAPSREAWRSLKWL